MSHHSGSPVRVHIKSVQALHVQVLQWKGRIDTVFVRVSAAEGMREDLETGDRSSPENIRKGLRQTGV
jgi:hypothetical protein